MTSHQGLHCLPLIQLFKTLKWIVNCTCSNFKLSMVKLLRCLNTKGKYGKVTDTEIKWSIISKSVMIIIFVVFIDQIIDYLINRASLNWFQSYYRYEEFCCHIKCPERGLTVFLKRIMFLLRLKPRPLSWEKKKKKKKKKICMCLGFRLGNIMCLGFRLGNIRYLWLDF